MPNEVWRPIKDYEGRYEVSSLGRVRSVFHNIVLTPDTARGYKRVTLFNKGIRDRRMVHILVAEAFIPNLYNKPHINHIDENRANNAVSNLEWCTPKENCNHGTRNLKISSRVSKPVKQLTKSGELIRIWSSMTEASEKLGITLSEISVCTRLHHKSAGGYKWRYVNERNQMA